MSEERLMKVLLSPYMSEKSMNVADSYRHVVFRVLPDASKSEVKQAVELLFKVKVEKVQTCNMKGKVKRTRQGIGKRKDWKKAYVCLAEGHDINFLSEK
ncbi:MAG: 50S ribosomal protein L23 [Gammaproteobacteria bacterium]|nr:50S ribosomal protein L23 [Gammaproteobacteria bacterium]MCP4473851.1 50S ribosomal protein L23 [Gammaproteobacteria bacterium]